MNLKSKFPLIREDGNRFGFLEDEQIVPLWQASCVSFWLVFILPQRLVSKQSDVELFCKKKIAEACWDTNKDYLILFNLMA